MSQSTENPHFCREGLARLVNAQVTVVGLGLMGGSLAGALRGHCRAVIGVARRAEPP